MSINQANEFESILRQQIYKILQEEKLLQGEWHLGKVEQVLSRYSLKAFIDGSKISYTVPCNPNIIFQAGDEIWVHFVNGDSKNKFASYKRATGTETIIDAPEGSSNGDMLKTVYDKNNNGIVDKAESVEWNGVANKPATFPPSTHSHSLDQVTETTTKKIMTDAERTKLANIENLGLGETSLTAYRGDRGKVAYDHSQSTHAPTNAQKNSDITKAEIEAKLTGVVNTHTHNYEPANSNIQQHISNNSIHVTTNDTSNWNNKIDKFDELLATTTSLDSDQFLIFIPSLNEYKKITKFDLLSGIGGGGSSDKYVLNIRRESFTLSAGQTLLTLSLGEYVPNTNRINVYISGMRQPSTAYQETSSTSITLNGMPNIGTKIDIEWFQLTNVMDYLHAQNHAVGGTDPISPADIGAETPSGAQTKVNNHANRTDNPHKITVSQIGAEPAFIKNSAFNKNFGSVVGTVAEGNHNHDSVYEPKNTNIQSHVSSKSNPHGVTKAQVGLDSVTNYGMATQAEAQTGTSNAKYMTPLRTKETIDSLSPVKSVSGKTGNIILSKSDVGLSNVDNVQQASKSEFDSHITNSTAHITPTERTNWNDANSKKHDHSNKNVLDKITQSGTETSFNLSSFATKDELGNAGYGDMTKGVYDSNNNGKVDVAEVAESVAWSNVTEKPTNLETTTGSQVKVDLHENKKTNPHGVTKAQVGLGNVDNVKQASKSEHDTLSNTVTSHVTDKVTDADGVHGIKIESGAWTPRFVGATTNGVITLTAGGNYHKVGRLVIAEANLTISTINSMPTGALQIAGLPFVSTGQRSNDSRFSGDLFDINNLVFSGVLSAMVIPNSSYIQIQTFDSNRANSNLLAESSLRAGTQMRIVATYLTN